MSDDRKDVRREPGSGGLVRGSPGKLGFAEIGSVAEDGTCVPLPRQRRLCAFGDQRPLLFGQCRIEVEKERVCIQPKLGHDERDALRHHPTDEMHVTGKPIKFGDDDGAFDPLGSLQRRRQLRPSIQRVRPLPGFHLREPVENLYSFAFRKSRYRFALSIQAKAGATLLRSRDSRVTYTCRILRNLFHRFIGP
jgi:hypothetical protein